MSVLTHSNFFLGQFEIFNPVWRPLLHSSLTVRHSKFFSLLISAFPQLTVSLNSAVRHLKCRITYQRICNPIYSTFHCAGIHFSIPNHDPTPAPKIIHNIQIQGLRLMSVWSLSLSKCRIKPRAIERFDPYGIRSPISCLCWVGIAIAFTYRSIALASTIRFLCMSSHF